MYWIFRTDISHWHNQAVRAQLLTPYTQPPADGECGYGFAMPKQHDPYGVNLHLSYQVNSQHPCPDNYAESFGFDLFSERLIGLMSTFDVKHESFAVSLFNEKMRELAGPKYAIFHSLEGVQDAMDPVQSDWKGSRRIGISQLTLDYSKFEQRPIFVCAGVFLRLIRDDLKQALDNEGITGFEYFLPEQYSSGRYRLGIEP